MVQLQSALRQMIDISEVEMLGFLKDCSVQHFNKKAYLSEAGKLANSVCFINRGLVRVLLVDRSGEEHTLHFASENQFIADYASFIQQKPAFQSLQAIEPVEAVVIPRSAIEWGYQNLRQGDRLGRIIAEFYFVYLDNRINSQYANDPATRYANIESVFPNIHNRAPQHMIASYLGITPVHLSRLKKSSRSKV
jgi:CRP-like cAMP-binding protein